MALALLAALLALPAAPARADCGLIAPADDLAGPVPAKPGAWAWGPSDRPPVARVRSGPSGPHPAGALAGKTVYLSAGHGFTWTDLGWRTQRGTHNGIVEDLVAAEAVDQYVIPYLQAMGAYVVPIRESDMNPASVIVDDGEAVLEGSFVASGATDGGWGAPALPLVDDTSPFDLGVARRFTAAASDTGRLVYAAAVPADGLYNVYVAYAQGPDRVPDAHYVVRHDGGETHFRVDQRRHGTTWVLLGKFHFSAGAGPDRAAVVLAADSSLPGAVISADAVRLGGGMGMVDRGGGVSGRPMYEQAARYCAQWNGAPADVFDALGPDNDDDVVSRSRFTAWEHEDGEDAVYLAWHSNAPAPQRGTSSYTYGPTAPPGSLDEFTGTPGSRELQDAVHAEIVADLRAAWDPAWTDEGRFTAYFGEVNPKHNAEVPAVLVEVAYHHTPEDADSLRDPRFRRIVAKAMAEGVARYFAAKDGAPLVLPPPPPTSLALRNDGAGGLRVAWRAPAPDPAGGDAPTGWRVYVSRDGRGFDDGTDVPGDSFEYALTGLAALDVRYVRVAAVNAGGHSPPSVTLGARVAPSGAATVAVVAGFDRLDAGLLLLEDLSAHDLGEVQRMWLDRMNDGTYVVRHGEAIAAAGYSFDSATDDAVADGLLDPLAYPALDWQAGQESSGDEPFTAPARALLAAYLDAGGRLFVSGSELAWALDLYGSPDEQAFFRARLRAAYADDDAGTYAAAGLADPFAGLAGLSFQDLAPGGYDVAYPDVLTANDSTPALAYTGGTPGTAAVAWGADEPGERGVYLGFPFETIAGADVRADVMARVLAHFDLDEPPAPPTSDSDTDADTDADTATSAASGDAASDTATSDTATTADDSATTAAATTGATTPDAPSDDEAGCGCRSTPTATAAPLLTLLLARRRRRR